MTLCVGPPTHRHHLLVYLRRAAALAVGVLAGGHLQHTHAEGVHVHGLVVMLLVHFRGHELRRAWRYTQISYKLFDNVRNLNLSCIDYILFSIGICGHTSPTYNRLSEAPILERGQAEVSYLDAARGARDEDVVALQISTQAHQQLYHNQNNKSHLSQY